MTPAALTAQVEVVKFTTPNEADRPEDALRDIATGTFHCDVDVALTDSD
jgi:hypothetical protein